MRSPASTPHVLLLDDDEILARALRRVLAETGVRVTATRTLTEARAVLGAGDVDAVLTDLHLEDGLGTDLVSELADAAAHVPVVVMSASPEEVELASPAVRSQIVTVLGKPFTVGALVAALGPALWPRSRW